MAPHHHLLRRSIVVLAVPVVAAAVLIVAGPGTSGAGTTVARSIDLPAQAMNEDPASSSVSRAGTGLVFENTFAEGARLSIHRPTDWSGSGDVTLKLLFVRTSADPGEVKFFVRPEDMSSGDPLPSEAGIVSNIQTGTGTDVARQLTMTIPTSTLQEDWWDLLIQRSTTLTAPYPDPVIVRSVSLKYKASA